MALCLGCSSGGQTDTSGDSTDDSDTDDISTTDSDTEIPAEPAVALIGRHDGTDPVRFGWPGSGAVVRFEGTGARVRLDDNAGFFTVVVDGEVQPRLVTSPGEQDYELASGLPDGEHTIELYRRTEGFFGSTSFFGFDLDGTLLAPPPVSRRLEIIGDSISCGYGNEGADAYCNFSADTENHYQTYGAIAARAVGAELSTVAWSGKGIIYNYGDDTVEPLPEIYERSVPSDDGTVWSFDWQPDAVLINLGTNDFSTDNDPSEALFVSSYVAFLEQIRENYPGAVILITVAPPFGGPDGAMIEGYLDDVVAERAAAGDPDVVRVDLSTLAQGLGCDWHPNVTMHEGMAEELIGVLAAEVGW